jgi:hydroxymethylbilane synthase
MSATVFISRDKKDCAELEQRLAALRVNLLAQSFIRIEHVAFSPAIPPTDWIFFSSKNSVQAFFAQSPQLENQRFAAVGKGTAELLKQYVKVDFIGEHIDTTITAQEFKTVVGAGSVLFPQSDISRKTIESTFASSQVIPLVCYSTQELKINLDPADIYVFTSPSNVRAFYRLNSIPSDAKVMAFGYPTQQALSEHFKGNIIIPEALDTESLVRTIKSLL